MSSASTSLHHLAHPLVLNLHSRRLLHHTPLYTQPSDSASSPVAPDSDAGMPDTGFDANVVMILAVLLCALICALGLNSIVRCALRCTNRRSLERDSSPVAARLTLPGARSKVLKELPTFVYAPGMKLAGAASECAICLSDFEPGERIRVLPKCNHGFHVRCIDRWLMARPTCPTCRQCLSGMCQKVSGCAEAAGTAATPVQSVIVPLEREGFVNSSATDR